MSQRCQDEMIPYSRALCYLSHHSYIQQHMISFTIIKTCVAPNNQYLTYIYILYISEKLIQNCKLKFCFTSNDQKLFFLKHGVFQIFNNKGVGYFDTLGSKVSKIAICQLRPYSLMGWANFGYGGWLLFSRTTLKGDDFSVSPPHQSP